MSRLSFIDLVFFLTESEQSPKHVGGLSIFKKPEGVGANWVRDFYQELISHDNIQPPFNHVINFRSFGGPSWRQAETVNITDHVFYHKPKKTMKMPQNCGCFSHVVRNLPLELQSLRFTHKYLFPSQHALN